MKALSNRQDYFTIQQEDIGSLLIEALALVHFSVPVLFCIIHPMFFMSQSEGLMDHSVLEQTTHTTLGSNIYPSAMSDLINDIYTCYGSIAESGVRSGRKMRGFTNHKCSLSL